MKGDRERLDMLARFLVKDRPERYLSEHRSDVEAAYNAPNVFDRVGFRVVLRLAIWIDRRRSPSKRRFS